MEDRFPFDVNDLIGTCMGENPNAKPTIATAPYFRKLLLDTAIDDVGLVCSVNPVDGGEKAVAVTLASLGSSVSQIEMTGNRRLKAK
jgi:hypothetical protein